MESTSYKPGFFNIVRWPDVQGSWWLLAESLSGYVPVLELHPHWNKKREMEPTYDNQLYRAAELLVEQGLDAVNNPHAMIGRSCRCGDCFCCAAHDIYSRAREVSNSISAVASDSQPA